MRSQLRLRMLGAGLLLVGVAHWLHGIGIQEALSAGPRTPVLSLQLQSQLSPPDEVRHAEPLDPKSYNEDGRNGHSPCGAGHLRRQPSRAGSLRFSRFLDGWDITVDGAENGDQSMSAASAHHGADCGPPPEHAPSLRLRGSACFSAVTTS